MIVLRRITPRSSELGATASRRWAAVIGVVVVIGVAYQAGRADERRSATRYAHASLVDLVWRYRLRHNGRCPRDLAAVARDASRAEVPRDGWGEPFALRCPSPREDREFDVVSAGPDRIPGGLDAVD
jgi:hypothetical protein